MTAAIDADAWDALVESSDPGSYLQLSGWARVKAVNGWAAHWLRATERVGAQVTEAIAAVQMRTPPTFCGFRPLLAQNAPDRCEANSTQVDIFSEDFETDPSSRWSATCRDWRKPSQRRHARAATTKAAKTVEKAEALKALTINAAPGGWKVTRPSGS